MLVSRELVDSEGISVMLICRNCGFSLPDMARFCGVCGVRVTPTIPLTLRLSDMPTDPALSFTQSSSLLEKSGSRPSLSDYSSTSPLSPSVQKNVRIFISYAQRDWRDQKMLNRLEEHLINLKYRGLITTWTAKEMNAGKEAIQQIDVQLNAAHIILLLVSASFFASEDCSRETMRAMQRHQRGEAEVIPVLLRPVHFTNAPFASLRLLPTNRKPVAIWKDRDSAFVDIAIGIELAVEKHLYGPLQSSAFALSSRIRLMMPIITVVGITLGILIEELTVLPVKYPTLALSPGIVVVVVVGSAAISTGILLAFRALVKSIQTRQARVARRQAQKRTYYEKALRAYEQALRQNNADATAYRGKGNALVGLGRYEAALVAFTQAVALMPLPLTYVHMGDVLMMLRRYDEAAASYRQALALDASYTSAYTGMRKAFLKLGRLQEAKQAYQQAKQLDGDD